MEKISLCVGFFGLGVLFFSIMLQISENLTTPDYQGYESAYDKGVEDTLIKYDLK